jgi:hypothetical protein
MKKIDVINKLDKCHIAFDLNKPYEIIEIDARNLLGYNRFDLYAILSYIDYKVKGLTDIDYALELYKERTKVMTNFTFSEVGKENKNNFNDFIQILDKLISDFKDENFNSDKTLIPVTSSNVLIDGAHRVACAAYFNQKLKIIKFTEWDINQNITAEFLSNRALPNEFLDRMVLEYCKWHKDIYIFFLWPKAFDNLTLLQKANNLINNYLTVIYRKKTKMKFIGIRNLMAQIYVHMEWISTENNHFQNAFIKTNEVWSNNGIVEFILVSSDSYEQVLRLRQEIYNIFQVESVSIHSTNNYKETKTAVDLIFNKNSFHHLIFGEPDKYLKSHHLIEEYKIFILKNGFNINDFIIDSSMTMAVYGIREANELDFYFLKNKSNFTSQQTEKVNFIESHDTCLQYYNNLRKEDLIYNPNNYFIYNELKFVSLEKLIEYKNSRKDAKDIEDILLIKNKLNDNKNAFLAFRLILKNKYRREKILFTNTRRKIMYSILVKMGLMGTYEKLYAFIKNNENK